MQAMETPQSNEEDTKEFNVMTIKQFIEITRQYLFGAPASQPVLATVPVRSGR